MKQPSVVGRQRQFSLADLMTDAGFLTKLIWSMAVVACFASTLTGCGETTANKPKSSTDGPVITQDRSSSESTMATEDQPITSSTQIEEPKSTQPVRLLAFKTPGFDDWVKEVVAMPAEQQVEAVATKLEELNKREKNLFIPTATIEDGVVTGFSAGGEEVVDISPVRAFVGLRSLTCGYSVVSDLSPLFDMHLTQLDCSQTPISDLSPLKNLKLTKLMCSKTKVSRLLPLQGMKLTVLDCSKTQVSDLSPLKDMPLTRLHCYSTKVSDLSPLKGMPLESLECSDTTVSDLSPLTGMPLTTLSCSQTKVSDLSPLKDMMLALLNCEETNVSDLSPLKGMKLEDLMCHETKITDLSPLRGMPLSSLYLDFKPQRDTEILRSIKTLKHINGDDVDTFWKKVDGLKEEQKP